MRIARGISDRADVDRAVVGDRRERIAYSRIGGLNDRRVSSGISGRTGAAVRIRVRGDVNHARGRVGQRRRGVAADRGCIRSEADNGRPGRRVLMDSAANVRAGCGGAICCRDGVGVRVDVDRAAVRQRYIGVAEESGGRIGSGAFGRGGSGADRDRVGAGRLVDALVDLRQSARNDIEPVEAGEDECQCRSRPSDRRRSHWRSP